MLGSHLHLLCKKVGLVHLSFNFSFVLLTFLLILILFHSASDINLLVELNVAGKNQCIELVEDFISALKEEVSLWGVNEVQKLIKIFHRYAQELPIFAFIFRAKFSQQSSFEPRFVSFCQPVLDPIRPFYLHCFLSFFSSSCK